MIGKSERCVSLLTLPSTFLCQLDYVLVDLPFLILLHRLQSKKSRSKKDKHDKKKKKKKKKKKDSKKDKKKKKGKEKEKEDRNLNDQCGK